MKRNRITWSWAIIMITLATIFDITQALLSVVTFELNDFVDPIFDAMILGFFWFIFYFFMKVNFTRTRALVYFGLGFLEFIPVVDDVLPLWIADVVAVMIMVAAEDRIPALNKLDQAVRTKGFKGKIANADHMRNMVDNMTKPQQNALRRVSGVIMKATGNREQLVAAQRARKQKQATNEPDEESRS